MKTQTIIGLWVHLLLIDAKEISERPRFLQVPKEDVRVTQTIRKGRNPSEKVTENAAILCNRRTRSKFSIVEFSIAIKFSKR